MLPVCFLQINHNKQIKPEMYSETANLHHYIINTIPYITSIGSTESLSVVN